MMSLEHVLESTAHKIALHGTQGESVIIEELAVAAHASCPGAAAALDDWNGPEIARLRAFGIVHGLLLRGGASAQPQPVDLAPAGSTSARAA